MFGRRLAQALIIIHAHPQIIVKFDATRSSYRVDIFRTAWNICLSLLISLACGPLYVIILKVYNRQITAPPHGVLNCQKHCERLLYTC